MSKLLHAGFARLFRNKVLLICFGILGMTNGVSIVANHFSDAHDAPDSFLLSGLMVVSIMTAVLTATFLGSEHQFGTIRNKLIIGHGRAAVYCSSFIVCFAGMLMLLAVVWILTLILGNLLLGGFMQSDQQLLVLLLRSFLAMTALTALYTALGLCIHSKSISAVMAVICAFLILLASVVIIQMLMEPEYYPADQVIMTEEMTYETAPDDPSLVINPYYLSGMKREMYETINDISPVSQMLDESGVLTTKAVIIPLAEITVLMAVGLLVFRKRDLK